MKKVLVIGSRSSGQKNDPSKIAANINSSGLSADVIYWEDLVFDIAAGSVRITVKGESVTAEKPDLVIALGWYKNGKESIYRDMAFSLALFIQSNGIRFWNSEMINQRSSTKLSCMVQLALEGISVPRTYFSLDIRRVLNELSMPFVAKAVGASRGELNYLIKTNEDMNQVYAADNQFIVQPYLVNDHDLRVICFNSVPSLVLKRARKQGVATHLNNTSQGGTANWMELSRIPSGLLTLSEKICKVTGREMAGIDFIPDASSGVGYSCLEVNAIPQLTSGIDPDKKMVALTGALKQCLKENGL